MYKWYKDENGDEWLTIKMTDYNRERRKIYRQGFDDGFDDGAKAAQEAAIRILENEIKASFN